MPPSTQFPSHHLLTISTPPSIPRFAPYSVRHLGTPANRPPRSSHQKDRKSKTDLHLPTLNLPPNSNCRFFLFSFSSLSLLSPPTKSSHKALQPRPKTPPTSNTPVPFCPLHPKKKPGHNIAQQISLPTPFSPPHTKKKATI